MMLFLNSNFHFGVVDLRKCSGVIRHFDFYVGDVGCQDLWKLWEIDLKLLAFKIENFRSIVDSGWVPFSPDGVTVLVGQNESGKTSVLEALYCGFSNIPPTEDDFRVAASSPSVHFRVKISVEELIKEIGADGTLIRDIAALEQYFEERKGSIEIKVSWIQSISNGRKEKRAIATCLDSRLEELLSGLESIKNLTLNDSSLINGVVLPDVKAAQLAESSRPIAEDVALDEPPEPLTVNDIALGVWNAIPMAVLFHENAGRLPNSVDIDEDGVPIGDGARAAQNYLLAADISLVEVMQAGERARKNILNKANARVSRNFNEFWSQIIGRDGVLELKCDLEYYPLSAGEKSGKPHLVFWICDGDTQLYPRQRSQGVRWFISFYLQLKAAEAAGEGKVFLLDEPGANLHSKAQGDVLSLINKMVKETSAVVYTTHSPQMIEYQRLYRIHAVQRANDLDDSPTQIIDAHRLGAASSDTLSPVLSAMGADLSQHAVIQKKNNVLLEEMSGYYYLKAFWRLCGSMKVAHFIAATGVNKIEALANMFTGWGLEFVIALDDDGQGREVFKKLKREYYGDNDELAKKYIIKLPCGTGIEDVFSAKDFAKYVLNDESHEILSSNTEFLKKAGRSKPVLAFNFLLSVERGDVGMEDFLELTRENIRKTVAGVEALLSS